MHALVGLYQVSVTHSHQQHTPTQFIYSSFKELAVHSTVHNLARIPLLPYAIHSRNSWPCMWYYLARISLMPWLTPRSGLFVSTGGATSRGSTFFSWAPLLQHEIATARIDQSISNRSIQQPINQLTSQPINQPINQATKPIYSPINQLITQPMSI